MQSVLRKQPLRTKQILIAVLPWILQFWNSRLFDITILNNNLFIYSLELYQTSVYLELVGIQKHFYRKFKQLFYYFHQDQQTQFSKFFPCLELIS